MWVVQKNPPAVTNLLGLTVTDGRLQEKALDKWGRL
jgi:hypothetical protein